VNKHLVELQERFFGAALAYDECIGAHKHDADTLLAAALWRNLYSGEKGVSVQHLNVAVGYTRSQLSSLCKMPTSTFTEGNFQWDRIPSVPVVLQGDAMGPLEPRERTPLTHAEFF